MIDTFKKQILKLVATQNLVHAVSNTSVPHTLKKERVYRVAVIGAGAMGRDQCLGLLKVPQAYLVALADQKTDALDRLRQEVTLPETTFYDDAQKLIQAEKLDLVSIATNTVSHIKIAQMVINAGISRIIIEKPIGNQVEAARTLAQQCAQGHIRLTVNLSRRWSNDYKGIHRCIEHGFIGNVRQIYASLGPGGLAMVGVHFIDLIAWLGQAPITWVIGHFDPISTPNRRGIEFHDPGGYLLLNLANGVRGYVDASDDLNQRDNFMIIRGETGRIEIDERHGVWHIINDTLGRYTFQFTDTTKPAQYFQKVAAEMLSDSPSSCPAEPAINALEAIVAAYYSSRNQQIKINLPLYGEGTLEEFPWP